MMNIIIYHLLVHLVYFVHLDGLNPISSPTNLEAGKSSLINTVQPITNTYKMLRASNINPQKYALKKLCVQQKVALRITAGHCFNFL